MERGFRASYLESTNSLVSPIEYGVRQRGLEPANGIENRNFRFGFGPDFAATEEIDAIVRDI